MDSRHRLSSARALYETMMMASVCLSGTTGLFDRAQRGRGGASPVVTAEDLTRVAEKLLACLCAGEQLDHRGCQRLYVRQVGRNVACGTAVHLASNRRIQHDRRNAGGERLEWCEAKALILGWKRVHLGAGIELP